MIILNENIRKLTHRYIGISYHNSKNGRNNLGKPIFTENVSDTVVVWVFIS